MERQQLLDQIDNFLLCNRDRMLRQIETLVAIPSVSSPADQQYPYGKACAQALDAALAIGKDLGFVPHNYDYRYGTLTFGNKGSAIGMFSHLDVVPAGNGWQYPPFSVTRLDDWLIGRGVNDDKGPAIAALYAMLCCKELGLPLKHDLLLFLGCEEEQSMSDVIHYVEHTPDLPVFSIIADGAFPVSYGGKGILALDLEASLPGGHICAAEAGQVGNVVADRAVLELRQVDVQVVRSFLADSNIQIEAGADSVRLTAGGRSAHAAKPAGSLNAIYVLCSALSGASFLEGDEKVLGAVADMLSDCYGEGLGIAYTNAEDDKLTHIAGMLSVPELSCLRVNFNIRYPIGVTGEGLLERIKERVSPAGFAVKRYAINPPGYFDPQHPIVSKLTAIYKEISGADQADPYIDAAATYARKLPNSVCFGPHFPGRQLPFSAGRGKEHMPDECVCVTDLLQAVKIYVLALLESDTVFG